MQNVLQKFITEPLFDATEAMLSHLHIRFTAQSKTPLSFQELYADTTSSPMPKVLREVVDKVNNTYLIGAVDEDTLEGRQSDFDIEKPLDGKYNTMIIFAVDIKQGCTLSRGELATLTRGFNRMAPQLPVILFVKNGDFLSLSTCERSEYRQDWREGEKLGKVSILRDIKCADPHRGHIDILEFLGDKVYPTFDELYKHWLEVLSNETLTKRFYRELQNWYFAALKVVRFPNDISTTSDDTAYNSEATIRLITRLIFVWFLKQRNLIPGELFDPDFVGNKLLKEFNPIEPQGLFSETQRVSYYYRGILQNLFFATLNTPLTKEGKTELTERRFKTSRDQFDVNVLMRYRDLFKDPELFITLCNRVPFLNGGLFDCLDRKSKGLYFDGFSERKASIDQLCVPDYLFFSDNIHADLSAEYDDKKQKNVVVRGLIKIFNSYQFTIEENTPLDQEVALDPELLGNVFENLLAAFNPETKQTARKQTGSFYTPRSIVQYMVDESLIAHLNRTVGSELETEYRKLLSYSGIPLNLSFDQKRSIMVALYNCKILDPACGSGAFPMGILQKMVHVLTKIDPDNTQWKEMLLNIAIDETSEAYRNATDNERQEVILDIERNFNDKVNRPDYARKLYLIENCIYGVDIQPIAIQISKLRFFISLVIDQKRNDNPAENYGIRPLPNLEAKFVAADSLRSLSGDVSLGDAVPSVKQLKDTLKQINHRIFSVKSHKWKKELEKRLEETRLQLAEELNSVGMFSKSESSMLAEWDMFNQNAHAEYFDAEWMFGFKDNFDIVIGNPPYVIVASDDPLKPLYDQNYVVARGGKRNLFHLFFEKGISLLKVGGVISFITPDTFLAGNDTSNLRKFFIKNVKINNIILYSEKDKVFKNVTQAVAVSVMLKSLPFSDFYVQVKNETKLVRLNDVKEDPKFRFRWFNQAIQKIKEIQTTVKDFFDGNKGDVNLGIKKDFFRDKKEPNSLPLIRGIQIAPYVFSGSQQWCLKSALSKDLTAKERIVFQEVANAGLSRRIKATILKNVILGDSCNFLIPKSKNLNLYAALAVVNSKVVNFYFKFYNQTNHVPIGDFKQIPFPTLSQSIQTRLSNIVEDIFAISNGDSQSDISSYEREIDLIVYKLYGLEYSEVLIIDSETSITREEYENLSV